MRCYVFAGVSGSGKSFVGTALSELRGADFVRGDDLHPLANIDKVPCLEALDDVDRALWLFEMGQICVEGAAPIMIGCSALKKRYRDRIRDETHDPVHFLSFATPKNILSGRMGQRSGYFMPASLRDRQFAALAQLERNEGGEQFDIVQPYRHVNARTASNVKETVI